MLLAGLNHKSPSSEIVKERKDMNMTSEGKKGRQADTQTERNKRREERQTARQLDSQTDRLQTE